MAGADRFFGAGGRKAALLAGSVLAVVLALGVRRLVEGQQVLLPPQAPNVAPRVDTTEADVPASDAGPWFVLAKEETKTLDKLHDFNRFVDRKSWALAFGALSSLAETPGTGMVQSKDGFWFPLRREIARSLAALPAEGRDAYRLYYDAGAKQLWEHVNNSKAAGKMGDGETGMEEMRDLQKIVNRYSMTSVGDLAADRLGDLLFERGDFGGAEGAWRTVIQDYPDTQLSPAKLQVKRCIALMRMGHREELAALVETVQERYAREKVTIGGQEVAAGEFVRTLLLPGQEAVAAPAPEIDAIRIKEGALWQIHALPPDMRDKIDAIRNGMSGYIMSAAPAAAVDEKHLYVNCLGVVYAADLETGKLLWRSGKFSDLPQKVMNNFDYGVDSTHFPLVLSGGKIYTLVQDAPNGNTGAYLECFDPEKGELIQGFKTPKWKTDKLGVTSISAPTIAGGVAYCVGIQGDTMTLLALNPETGAAEWRLPLGKPQETAGYRGAMQIPEPGMVATSGMLYVLTNNSALLAVNTSQRRVEWAFHNLPKLPAEENDQRFRDRYNGGMSSEALATLVLEQNTLYVKDSGGDMLYAIDPAGPALRWSRQIDPEYSIFAFAGKTAYLAGENGLAGLDLNADADQFRKLDWTNQLDLMRRARPLVTRKHIYLSRSHGIYDIDLSRPSAMGNRFPSADHEGTGGRLLLAGDKLIDVRDNGVTAYRAETVGAVRGGRGGGQ